MSRLIKNVKMRFFLKYCINASFPILLGGLFCALSVYGVSSSQLHFNVNSLRLTEEQKKQIDLELLSRTDIQMPGVYEVTVRVNRVDAGKFKLNFVVCDVNLCPELTPAILSAVGVNVKATPRLKDLDSDKVILHLEDYIQDAVLDFEFERAEVHISIPQAAMDNSARGYISPELWDDGIPMLFTSYSISGAETRNRKTNETYSTQYVNLRSGANTGPWRIRNYSYYQHNRNVSQWKTLQTWVERDLRTLRTRLAIGETSSPGLIFDSFSFRGVRLSTQEEMLPDSMRGYAPQITGVAITNATVEVRQNGNLLYQTYVSPGRFVINDLYSTTTSGDFEITIREEDGTVRTTVQAFASPAVAVRQGTLKYSVSAGSFGSRYYNNENSISQRFGQVEVLYGLMSNTSLYAGLIGAEHYRSGVLGIGQGLGSLGAVSLDVTHAETQFNSGERLSGQSWRARYSKRFDTTGTSMTLAGYRYATSGYYDFDEASNGFYTQSRESNSSLKSRAQMILSQNVDILGSLSISASKHEYWNGGSSENVSGSWSKTYNGITLNISQTQSKSGRSGRTDNVTSATISLPIGKWLYDNSSSVRLSNSFTRSDSGSSALNSTLSGTALDGRNLSWSMAQARSESSSGKTTNSTSLSATYQGGLASVNLGYSDYYGQSRRLNWGARGAVVAHPYGVTLSPPLSEGSGYALVRAPDASGVNVKNKTGLSTDRRGYAVVPSMTAYRENTVTLDTASLKENIELMEPIRKAIPTREALVLADYRPRVGFRALLNLRHNGSPVPFSTVVSAGESQGIVGDNGQVYLSGLANLMTFTAALSSEKQCMGTFDVTKAAKQNGLMMADVDCL